MLTPDVAVDLVRDSLYLVMLLVTVLIAPGLVVGLVVSLLQAATQINEQTLSFLPRLLVTLLAITLMGRWLAGTLMDYCVAIFQRAAALVG
ncbi:flagellar biosynthesis protein FliQ [Ramlibacter sp. H39-3-26]|uniref:flagellar biosynthesis protein FliQ n=1 Tax=Curvibacter soli TaxID=3031331 RepID=UPI0023DB7672|nr:flagellar biosynthesis protein FliQ [Ramlibacter sp. H39-3-26]MDF1484225.1 flagellar biosynthesis protein FliQ [Ramlibacter sp. H39-3-26]